MDRITVVAAAGPSGANGAQLAEFILLQQPERLSRRRAPRSGYIP
jgi:hypothetical protein